MSLLLLPFQATGRTVLGFFQSLGAVSLFAFQALKAILLPPYYPGQLLHQMFRIGYLSLPVVGLTALFTGAALALNIYTGGSRFNAEQFVPNIVALGIVRELGPVIAAIMIAGRVSSG